MAVLSRQDLVQGCKAIYLRVQTSYLELNWLHRNKNGFMSVDDNIVKSNGVKNITELKQDLN